MAWYGELKTGADLAWSVSRHLMDVGMNREAKWATNISSILSEANHGTVNIQDVKDLLYLASDIEGICLDSELDDLAQVLSTLTLTA